jgi:hypothetical protein
MDDARRPAPGVDGLHEQLRRSLRHGTRAAQLLIYSRPLIDALTPPEPEPVTEHGIYDRALRAEELIRAAITEIGGTSAEILLIITQLKPGYHRVAFKERRKAAANLLGIQPETFRRGRHEEMLLLELAIQLYRDLRSHEGGGGSSA